jgi:4-amino-4-deoxy-L-arabinose transferase-like glycosyltransferase
VRRRSAVLTSAAMSNETGEGGTGRSSFLVSLFLALLLCFAAIGSHSLWSPDEPTGAGVGRAMRDGGDWIVPRLNGEPFLEKPPLYWWSLAASLSLLGISDAAARVPSALFGVLTLMVAWTAGRRLGSPRQGLLAVVVLATTMLFVQNATRVTVDPALMLFIALAHLGFVLLAEPRSPGEARWARLLARSIIVLALSLAFLAKGIVALGLGAGPPVLYLLATRRARFLRELLLLTALGIPVFALLVAPWAVALQRAAGWDGLRECLVNNTVSRFVHTDLSRRYGHTEPFWFYLAIAPAWLLPWTLALPAMLLGGMRSGIFRRETPGSDGHRLLLATAGIGLLMLSIPSSKREVYLLPLLPAFAVCVAGWLDGVGKPGELKPGELKPLDRRTLLALGGFAAILPLLLGAAALWLAWAPHVPGGAAALRGALPAAGIAGFGLVSLALGAGLALGLARHWRRSPSVSWVMAALLLLVLGLETAVEGFVDPVKRTDELTAALASYFPRKEPIPGYLPPVVSNEAIFGIIGFKLGRTVHPLSTPEEVRAWLAGHPGAPLLVRMEELRRLPPDLQGGLAFVYDERGRKSAPFGIAVWRGASRGLSASRPAPGPGRGGA